MHHGPAAGVPFFRQLCERSEAGLNHTTLGVAAPAVTVAALCEAGSSVPVGVQNVHWEDSGAFTGEISPGMAREVGASFVLAGHSERRKLFKESEQDAASRALAALKSGMSCIFCVGETEAERERGEIEIILKTQLNPLTDVLQENPKGTLVIAYEPVWAIGTGKVASPKEIEEAHTFLREYLQSRISEFTPLLYGGSVKAENFPEIAPLKNVDGALVGGASLKMETFGALINVSEEIPYQVS